MFIDKNSIIINQVVMGNYITEAKYGYHKLWSSDSGRNLAGEQTGSLVGVFPKITLQFRKLNKDELEYLAPILDSAVQNVTYYDPLKKQSVTMQTYTGDYEIINRNILGNTVKNQAFSCAFISTKKRV